MEHTGMLTVRLDANDLERFRLVCEDNGTTMSTAIRNHIAEAIDGRHAQIGRYSRQLAKVGEASPDGDDL